MRIDGCLRITDAVLLTGDDLRAVAYAIGVAQWHRKAIGRPPIQRLEDLRQAMSPRGQADMPQEPVGQAGLMVDITTEETAGLLRCSVRQVRRLALALGGRRVGGRWILDRQAVLEHIEGRNAA